MDLIENHSDLEDVFDEFIGKDPNERRVFSFKQNKLDESMKVVEEELLKQHPEIDPMYIEVWISRSRLVQLSSILGIACLCRLIFG